MTEAAMTWLPGIKRREKIEWDAEECERANRYVTEQYPVRDRPSRAADTSDRLGTGELHEAEVENTDGASPKQQPGHRDHL